ncbi:MAG: FAD:protein FMN transferase [Spirosomataceae bacterium]
MLPQISFMDNFFNKIPRRSSVLLFLFLCFDGFSQNRYEFSHQQMGTIFRIVLYAGDSSDAKVTADKAFKKLDELNLILSDYREDSEINQLCRNSFNIETKVSTDLWKILKMSENAYKQTNGKFDVTIGPMTQLWRRMKRQKQLPTTEQIQTARSKVGFENIVLNSSNQTVLLKKEGIRLDFGGIGKGYAEDEMMKILKENGVKSAMIEGGGNIVVSDSPPNQKGWTVEINKQVYSLKNCGISTSGDLYQFVEIDGKKYSHILEPSTGIGMTNPIQKSVIAKDGTTSDWISTALCLMDSRVGEKLAKKLKVKVL